MKRNNCMFVFPHELTGMGAMCGRGLFGGRPPCNECGKKCRGYRPHDKYTRKILAEAIAEKRKQEGGAK